MRDQDYGAFSTMLEDLAAFYPQAKAPTAGQKAMFFRALRDVTLDAVRAAFDAHMRDPQRGRFMPLPADVIAQVQGAAVDDGRPGAEEAWATAMRGQDEGETIVWTAETADAFGIARFILAAGDEVGARMAFREAYERLVGEARRARAAIRWTPSLGLDPQRRERALAQAVERGLLPVDAFPALPAPRGAVALLEGAGQRMPAAAQEALFGLRDWLTARRAGGASVDAVAREQTEAARADARRLVAGYDQAREAAK